LREIAAAGLTFTESIETHDEAEAEPAAAPPQPAGEDRR